ncbi:hypothetical protein BDB01DRAFT_845298 [Pilobolus umbonatus]|nr:hypothetical protein BDB01DRAFT_845298 [Pilobolus umbonatus]
MSTKRRSSLSDKKEEEILEDVLYPRYTINKTADVDLNVFNELVANHIRKKSLTLIPIKKTPDRHMEERFVLYSTQENIKQTIGLTQLLTEGGQEALASVMKTKGWWLDVVSPTVEEMRIMSKTFHIHPLTAEDIQAQESREKVELFPNYTFVCFRAFDTDLITDRIKPFNYYTLIFKEGLLSFHFKKSDHCDLVRKRADQLKEFMYINSDWINYALIDCITDGFGPIITQIEMEAVSIDELSLVLRKSEQSDMLRRISRCRKRSTQLSRLLTSKLDVIKSLMKRYEDRTREYLINDHLTDSVMTPTEEKKAFNDVLLYLGDIQDHVVTMVQNIVHYDRILHRAHTNYLAQVNLELTQTYNMTNAVMNRLTFLATVFIPLTLICSLWGMNVYVPGGVHKDAVYFFWILGGMTVYCTVCIFFGKRAGLL